MRHARLAIAIAVLLQIGPAYATDSNTKGKFTIKMPCPDPSQDTEADGKITLNCTTDTGMYTFTADLSKANAQPDTIYQDTSTGVAKAFNGRLRSQKNISLDGLKGREFLFDGSNLVVRMREFIKGEMFFALIYVGLPDCENDSAVSAYMDSFRIP